MVTTHRLAYFRMKGLSSMAGYLPICDANALTLELGELALINGARVPVFYAWSRPIDQGGGSCTGASAARLNVHGLMRSIRHDPSRELE